MKQTDLIIYITVLQAVKSFSTGVILLLLTLIRT